MIPDDDTAEIEQLQAQRDARGQALPGERPGNAEIRAVAAEDFDARSELQIGRRRKSDAQLSRSERPENERRGEDLETSALADERNHHSVADVHKFDRNENIEPISELLENFEKSLEERSVN
jgi:hypothetical protein